MEQEIRNPTLDQIAGMLIRRQLALPAKIFLEMHLPLTALAHTSTLLFQPLLTPLFGLEKIEKFSALLANRQNVEYLIRRLDEPLENVELK